MIGSAEKPVKSDRRSTLAPNAMSTAPRGHVLFFYPPLHPPTYRAYTARASSGLLVPLISARPSAKTVIS